MEDGGREVGFTLISLRMRLCSRRGRGVLRVVALLWMLPEPMIILSSLCYETALLSHTHTQTNIYTYIYLSLLSLFLSLSLSLISVSLSLYLFHYEAVMIFSTWWPDGGKKMGTRFLAGRLRVRATVGKWLLCPFPTELVSLLQPWRCAFFFSLMSEKRRIWASLPSPLHPILIFPKNRFSFFFWLISYFSFMGFF